MEHGGVARSVSVRLERAFRGVRRATSPRVGARVAPEISRCDTEPVARRPEKNPPLVIYASVDRSGTTYSLSERTRHVIREKFGDAVRLHSRIFVSDETSADYEQLRGPMREQVIQLLTGLSESRLKELGVVEFRNPASDEAVA